MNNSIMIQAENITKVFDNREVINIVKTLEIWKCHAK